MTLLRRWWWLGLGALVALSSGCNIPALSYFLFSPDEQTPPSLKRLATDDKNQKVRVAILATSSNLQVSDQLSRVDRELSAKVVKQLKAMCKTNKENVEVLPVNVVESYKNKHPDWDQPLDLARIGKDLKVKYIIYLEINSLSLYKPKSNNMFYQGETDIRLTLVNARKPDDLPETDEYHERYPDTEIDTADDPNPQAFRSKFLDHIAERICWKFTSHSPEKGYISE
jgi:hypothetical protein